VTEDALSVSLGYGPHALLSSFVASWLETARTWLRPNELADEFSAHGSYDVTDSAPWGWRSMFVKPTPDELVVSHSPAGDEYLDVETRNRRRN
jgi:hypothetical protein